MTAACTALGLIPAHAGSTGPRATSPRRRGAHPRSRGEHPRFLPGLRPGLGSSPLTRGAPPAMFRCYAGAGLIPAHAGSTPIAAIHAVQHRAHPRSRGEHEPRMCGSGGSCGSSPLTRGALCSGLGIRLPPRLIPAHAGSTDHSAEPTAGGWAHPRSRGEH